MTLHLCRSRICDGAIVGRLSINGVFECFTLEDAETAIPADTYHLAITFSHRFQRDTPELLDVPGHAGIRIHAGNTAADTSGCLLVGKTRGSASVHQSRLAFGELYDLLRAADGPLSITIDNPAEPQKAA